jgi:hypothetical protein
MICSLVTALLKWARGFLAPFWWLFQETWVMASLSLSMGILYLAA